MAVLRGRRVLSFGLAVIATSTLLPNGEAVACCSYGCCDCGCVSAVPDPVADDVMEKITKLLVEVGYESTNIDLVVRTKNNQTVVMRKHDGTVQQPPGDASKATK